MTTSTVTLSCDFDQAKAEIVIEVPEGWDLHSYGIDTSGNTSLCPDHAGVRAFFENQCPGCVSGWGGCGLYDGFAFDYPDQRTLTDADFASLEAGVCPKRTNGTFGFSAGKGFTDIDLSEQEVEGGKAMASAIRDYIERYPAKSFEERYPNGILG